MHWRRILREMCSEWLQVCGVKTLRVLASIYKSNRQLLIDRMDKSQHD
jgi:hypothetical protein